MKAKALRNFTPDEMDFVKQHSGKQRDVIAKLFNEVFKPARTAEQIKSLCSRKKWPADETGAFKKGLIPFNKGKKFPGSRSETSFKKGRKPHNWMPVGSTRLTADGFHSTKIANPNCWKETHRILWEKHNGPVPKRMVLRFITGDRTKPENIRLDNLMLVTMAENLRLNQNQYQHMPDEIKPTVLALSQLEVKAFSLQKEQRT